MTDGMKLRSLCVYCGSSDRVDGAYLASARQMGTTIARHGLRLVYGGGSTGMMGAVADAALDGGAEVIGVIPERFYTTELAHKQLTEMHVVETMHIRKAKMVELAEAFVALPGGFGTFEELFEMLTWAQVGLHSKPVGILNIQGYFDPLLRLIEHAQEQGFLYSEHRSLLVTESDPDRLIQALNRYQRPPGLERWLNRHKEE
jgi:uncharacterized protein (TIGR00730 family)